MNFYNSRDPVVGALALLMLLIPILSGATWLFFASGKIMRCDAHELHFARRRTWGKWRRFRFASAQVRGLQRAFRGSSKSRSFTVLTFHVEGERYDMLEDLNANDSEHILKACKAMGLDAVIVVDESAAMLRDIDKRGWFINPLRPDQDETSSTTR